MIRPLARYAVLSGLAALSTIIFWFVNAAPATAHWADLATAEIVVAATETQLTLTYPTGLTSFADDDGNQKLSASEISRHAAELRTFFSQHIAIQDSRNQLATVTVQPFTGTDSTGAKGLGSSSHTTLGLVYAWQKPPSGLEMSYTLFVPDAPQASCLATISQAGQLTTHVFTPKNTTLALLPAGAMPGSGRWLLPLLGAFMWGAVHSLSPGHGKMLVGAYLVGERATSRHAIFLALATTISHTLGVFALGLGTVVAARYILPEQIYPWLSLLSGGMIIVIGANLAWGRLQRHRSSQHHHSHDHSGHSHDHSGHSHGHHAHSHGQDAHGHDHALAESHGHDHAQAAHPPYPLTPLPSHHGHSHLPLTPEGNPLSWRGLLMLGLSAGLVPCPAAVVLLLGAIALGNPLSGLLLVLFFSLGLASVLIGLGVLLISAKGVFKSVSVPRFKLLQWLPVTSAVGIALIGVGISTRAILQLF
ncbi:MAG: nickel/cobalt transporter [Nodosilinea sp.]